MGSPWYFNFLFGFSNKVVIHSRHICISSKHQAIKQSISKQGTIFNKLIMGSSKKKRKFVFDDSRMPSPGTKLDLGQQVKYNKENSRRITVLNTVFMKHVSDLLVTGNIGVDVVSKGLEITRVSMTPNFNQLNVFWGCNTQENIAELENVLPNVSFTLRHELSQLKVVGVVPRILFIKDKNFNDGAKVDYLLRIADFGEDHELTQLESDFKNTSVTKTLLDKKQSLGKCETSSEMSTSEDEEEMPVMRQDVFNLDHQLIMKKIMKKMQKSRAIHRFEPNLAIKTEGNSITAPSLSEVDKMTKQERKEAFAKFIVSRRILLEKKRENKYKSQRDVYMAQELENEEEEFVVEDYIEEVFDEDQLKK